MLWFIYIIAKTSLPAPFPHLGVPNSPFSHPKKKSDPAILYKVGQEKSRLLFTRITIDYFPYVAVVALLVPSWSVFISCLGDAASEDGRPSLEVF